MTIKSIIIVKEQKCREKKDGEESMTIVEQVGKATGQVVRKLRTGMSNIQLCSAL
jgi:hypothetical protein